MASVNKVIEVIQTAQRGEGPMSWQTEAPRVRRSAIVELAGTTSRAYTSAMGQPKSQVYSAAQASLFNLLGSP